MQHSGGSRNSSRERHFSSPVAQSAEYPPLKRKVDGANPSRAAIARKPKRTSEPPPVGSRMDLRPTQIVGHVHCLPPFLNDLFFYE